MGWVWWLSLAAMLGTLAGGFVCILIAVALVLGVDRQWRPAGVLALAGVLAVGLALWGLSRF